MGPNATFEMGKIYKVTHRTFDNSKTITARRKYYYTEKRFNEIPCYVFSSRVQRNRWTRQVLSIPHYDLIAVDDAA